LYLITSVHRDDDKALTFFPIEVQGEGMHMIRSHFRVPLMRVAKLHCTVSTLLRMSSK
jgi:hypothetical protein